MEQCGRGPMSYSSKTVQWKKDEDNYINRNSQKKTGLI